MIGLFLLTQTERRRDVVYDDRDRVRDPIVRSAQLSLTPYFSAAGQMIR